mmetsp:Transcript_40377/g.79631  ORF Transcript_40377/g.79631 Transcript_40377/m.79631 type:complete len:117 (-) Transcript_40377:485-835(-)
MKTKGNESNKHKGKKEGLEEGSGRKERRNLTNEKGENLRESDPEARTLNSKTGSAPPNNPPRRPADTRARPPFLLDQLTMIQGLHATTKQATPFRHEVLVREPIASKRIDRKTRFH